MLGMFVISGMVFADQSDVKSLIQNKVLFDYSCSFDELTYIARYEDEAYMGPTHTTKKEYLYLISENATEAVKQMLLFAATKKTESVHIDPMSISCELRD